MISIFQRLDASKARHIIVDQREHVYQASKVPPRHAFHTSSIRLPWQQKGHRMRWDKRVLSWTKSGLLLGTLWGFLSDSILFPLPGTSFPLVSSALAEWILAVIEGAVVFGALSAFCAILVNLRPTGNTTSSSKMDHTSLR